MKRILSIFLVVLMLLTTAPLTGLDGLFASKAEAYSVGDHIQYGNYPQSKVTDSSTLALLSSMSKNWVSYRYYSGSGTWNDGQMAPADYMYYADLDTNGDGLRDYRAVRIDKCRQGCTGYTAGSFSYQEDNGYTQGNTYYFKFEPISWRILDPSDGLILTENIMDCQAYNNYIISSGNYCYGDSSKTYYANDYYNSSIRKWLNEDFYNTAFNSSQAKNIRNDVTLNNDCYGSSYPQYNSQASKDKMFLLSYNEARNSAYRFSSYESDYDTTRRAQGTDYAGAQGLHVDTYYNGNSYWWLRSSSHTSDYACIVRNDGYFTYFNVNSTIHGVRVACRLTNLQSNIIQSKIGNSIGSGLEEIYSVGDHIQYGNYPQSQVTDSSTLALLNSMSKNWVSYRYYSGTGSYGSMAPADYMYYADLDTNGDGLRDYRAVRIDKYRQYWIGYTAGGSDTYQDDNGYTQGNTYYFKYEPISWRILDPSDGLILTEKIMDSQAYNNYIISANGECWGDSSKSYYANDYYNSSIRKWLNEDFFNTAFNSSQAKNIRNDVTLNNDCYSSSHPQYNSQPSKDKMFLLSYNEAKNSAYRFSALVGDSDTNRRAQGTDYAKTQGLRVSTDSSYKGDSWWWLRSPFSYSSFACTVGCGGHSNSSTMVDSTDGGVRVACRLTNLQSNIIQSTIGNSIGSGAEGGKSLGTSEKEYSTGDAASATLKIVPKDKEAWASGSIANIDSLTGEAKGYVKTTKATAGGQTFEFDNGKGKKSIDIPYGTAKSGVTISATGFNDYIIPAKVAESFLYRTIANVHTESIYMTRDKKDSKPYISTVFAKTSGYAEAFTNIVDSSTSFSIKADSKYDIIISAGNVRGKVTYYLSQDSSRKMQNSTGVFSSEDVFSHFDKSRTIYAYVVAENGGSSTVPLKLKLEDIEDSPVVKALRTGSVSIGGSNAFSMTMPKDWVLVGGKTISLEYFKKVPVSVEVGDDGRIRVAVGFGKDLLSKDKSDASKKKNDEKMSLIKQEIEGWKKQSKKWKESNDGYNDMKKIAKKVTGKDTFTFSSQALSLDTKVLGYIEGYYRNGTITYTAGSIAVSGDLTLSYDFQGNGWVCGVSGGAKVGATGEYSREIPDSSVPCDFTFTLNLTPHLKLYGGVGIQKVATADIYGKAELPINWVPTQSYWNISLQGEVGVEVQVFCFKTGEIPILEGSLSSGNIYYGKNKSFKAPAYLSPGQMLPKTTDTAVFETADRDYLENTSDWLGDKTISNGPHKVKPSTSTASGVEIKNLQTSVYDNSNAQIINCGNTAVAVWVTDDSSRDEYNRAKLVYSIYDGNTQVWSEPKSVCDDGFIDANPTLATDGTNIYVAWQKLCKTFDENNSKSTSDLLEAGEVYLAKYDKTTNSFVNSTRLTNNKVYDYNPTVSVVNGTPVVTYATDNGNRMESISGNTISQYKSGNVAVLKTNLPTVYSLVSAPVSGNVQIAYSVDTDSNVTTTDDITTYYGVNTFTTFEKANEASMMNSTFAEFEGKNTLFMSDGKNIYYNYNGQINKVFEDDIIIEGNIVSVKTKTGLALFWTNETEKGNELYTCTYADGKWSNAVAVTNRGKKLSNLSFSLVGNKVIGIGDETERIFDEETETYSNGATNLIAITANDFVDLTAAYVIVNEAEIIPGNTTVLDVSVENNGNITSENIDITVTDDNGTETTETVSADILPGETKSFEVEYTVPQNFNASTITVKVEDTDRTDVDKEDNTTEHTFDTSRLEVGDVQVTEVEGTYSIQASLSNMNIAPTENATIDIYVGDMEGDPVESFDVKILNQYDFVNFDYATTEDELTFIDDGVASVFIVANADNASEYVYTLPITKENTTCGHPVTEILTEIPATCTENGFKPGTFCTACETYVSGGEEIPATGHTEETIPTVPATCTQTGLSVGKKCSVCGAVTVDQTQTAVLPHTDANNDAICDVCGTTMSDILPGETKTVQITANQITYLKFIPTVSGTYTFQSNSSSDTYGYLYNANKTQITYNDDGGSGSNFKITYHLTAGTVYYFGARYYSSSNSGSFDVSLTLDSANEIHEHSYTSRVTTQPTCTSEGVRTYTCECGDSYTEAIVKSAHNESSWITDRESSCTIGGSKHTECTVCGETIKTDAIPVGSHKYKSVVTAPTCTTEGFITYSCTVCGNSYIANKVSALGHDIEIDMDASPAECTIPGNTESSYCTRCDYKVDSVLIPATGHNYSSWKTVKAATCSATGSQKRICSNCGDKQTKSIAKLAHTYKNVVTKATLTANGKITPTCSVCGAKKTATAIYMPKTFTLSASKATYTGKAIVPTVTVKDSKGNVIDAKYYTVTYADNTNVGTATVTIKFKTNYSGTKTLNFTIAPKQVTGLKSSAETTTSLKLTWTKVTGAKYYKVEQSTDGKTWTVIAKANTTNSITVSKLKAGTKYQFRVTALDSTKKIAGKASAVLNTGTLTATPTIKLTSTKKATATVTITKVTGATKYTIYKSTDNKKWTKVGDTTKLTYDLTKLTGGKKIYVKVVAVNAYGKNSAYSKVASVTVKK